jgi:hypothetical protein
MYGKMGEKDLEVIDSLLARLPRGGVVVNLGCGPNYFGELHALARSVRSYQFRSTLILADINANVIKDQVFIGPEKVCIVSLNAATATQQVGEQRADIILALGLFGDLSRRTSSEGTGEAAWPAVLKECLRLLKPGGNLIVSNSCERQPLDHFQPAVDAAGFVVHLCIESNAIERAQEKRGAGERRYLLICSKPAHN